MEKNACEHYFEFSSDTDEPEMKCDKCGEPLEVVSSIELAQLRAPASPVEPEAPAPACPYAGRRYLAIGEILQYGDMFPSALSFCGLDFTTLIGQSVDKAEWYVRRLDAPQAQASPMGLDPLASPKRIVHNALCSIYGKATSIAAQVIVSALERSGHLHPTGGSFPAIRSDFEKDLKSWLDASHADEILKSWDKIIRGEEAGEGSSPDAAQGAMVEAAKVAMEWYDGRCPEVIQEMEALRDALEAVQKPAVEFHRNPIAQTLKEITDAAMTAPAARQSEFEAHRIAKHWIERGDKAKAYEQARTYRNGLQAVESFLRMTTGQFSAQGSPESAEGEAK